MRNGHFKKTRNSIYAKNTTLIDSVFHILFSIMADDEEAKNTFIQSASTDMQSFVENYFKRGAVQQTYLARNRILKKVVDLQCIDDMKILDCTSLSTERVINRIVAPIWPSILQSQTCKCGRKDKRIGFANVIMNLTKNENLFDLQKESLKCDECLEEKIIINDLNNIVFVDINQECTFQNIPKVISIDGNIFCLVAFVSESNSKHFVAHVLRGKFWYSFDSSFGKVVKSKLANKIRPHLLVYAQPSLDASREILIGRPDDIIALENFHVFIDAGKSFRLNRVCGPDSLLHSFICLFLDDSHLFRSVDPDDKLLLLLKAYERKDMETVYKYRLNLLKDIFDKKEIENVTIIDCDSNVYNVVKNLFSNTFPSASLKCDCGNSSSFPFVDVNYDELHDKGIANLQSCLYKPTRTCDKCKLKMSNVEYSNILCIDVQPLDNRSIMGPIESIPNELKLGDNNFRIKSIIDYSSYGQEGHYKSFSLRNDRTWYCLNDSPSTIFITNRAQPVSPHVLIYVKV